METLTRTTPSTANGYSRHEPVPAKVAVSGPQVAKNSGLGVAGLIPAKPAIIAMAKEEGRVSVTARNAALGRAEQAKYGAKAGLPENGNDTAVAKLIPFPYRLALLPGVHNVIRRRVLAGFPGSYGYVYSRTRYFDDVVKTAVKNGATQVVILGAGFDTRGVRLATPGVTTYEVDLPATQREKIKRMDAAHYDRSSIRYVPLDLDRSSLTESLVKQGFDRSAKTCVIAEGLTFYIEAAAFQSILGFIRRDCGAGSVFAFDSIDDATVDGTTKDPDAITTRATVAKGGEPFTFGLKRGPGETAKLIGAAGLTLVEDLTPADLERRNGLDKAKLEHPHVRVGGFYGLHLVKN